jgi:hypothetical protein
LFYNGRDGLRDRYWQGAAAGDAATASLVALLREKLLRFAAFNPENFGPATSARGNMELVARSLDGASAKAWAYEEKNQRFDARPRLTVRRWLDNDPGGKWKWAPIGPLLDIKGAFYTLDNKEFVPLEKRERAHHIHRYGFS